MAGQLTRLSLRPGADASEIRRLLARFSGALRIHATMETDALYPALFEAADPDVRERAEKLHADVGTLYDMYDDFEEKWNTAEAIASRSIRFRIELVRVLATLGRRMNRENRELYPMVDALDSGR